MDQEIRRQLCAAADKHDFATLREILLRGTSVDLTINGCNLLLRASADCDELLVRELLVLGADPNYASPSGWTPLMWAVSKGCERIVYELIQYGADVNARAGSTSAIELAHTEGNSSILTALLESGAVEDPIAARMRAQYAYDSFEGADISKGT